MTNPNKTFDFAHFLLPTDSQTVECLGHTFENDQARRSYFLEQLRQKLQQPEFKNTSGFPHASEEAILALSDPPYYTACPNPWISDFIKKSTIRQDQHQIYHREPFATDVSEGKNDLIYNAHSYHTKVPHKAIMRYLLHYTQPGDIVFDGFCGTGMTGVAAQLCGDQRAVEALGYRVLNNGKILEPQTDENGKIIWNPFSQLGTRRVILNDLSPAATFIAYNYNMHNKLLNFEQEALQNLQEVETECRWMYQTLHTCTKNIAENTAEIKKVILGERNCPNWLSLGHINYVVWSDIFICSACTAEIIFWEAAVDPNAGKIRDKFPCPHCQALLTKRHLTRASVTDFDQVIGQTIKQAKQVPVLINYSVGKQRYDKNPDIFDFALLEKIDQTEIPYWFPTTALPNGYNTRQPRESHGISHLHHFYTKRNLWVLAAVREKFNNNSQLLFLLTGILNRSTKMNRIHLKNFFFGGGGWNAGYLKGTLYISSLPIETSILIQFEDRLKTLKNAFNSLTKTNTSREVIISSSSAHIITSPNDSVDYIFLDPPFGSNLMYSEINFIWEAWLQVFTNNQSEAIINKTQGKNLTDYRVLMTKCFQEAFRILKPGRWLTIEFSNTQASVWNTIQTALLDAGFIIANISTLDKKQGSFKAVTTTTAVKQDLIISAYKPSNEYLEKSIEPTVGSEVRTWKFVRNHLKYLPISKKTLTGEWEWIAEREPRILYDRMVAHFVRQGDWVPLSSQAFQAGLLQRFPEREGMIFLPEQIHEYERQRRFSIQGRFQMEIAVSDERSAIDWLQSFLKKRPSTYQEIHPAFIKLLGAGWNKYEIFPELDMLLELNFLKYTGKGEVPRQIYNYLTNNFEELSHLAPDDPRLQKPAAERWYVPDLHQAHDLDQLRDKFLLREFETYRQNPQKRLKQFRLEAIRVGFKKAWGERNYHLILQIAAKLPESVLHEDEKLLLWYDQALIRLEKLEKEGSE